MPTPLTPETLVYGISLAGDPQLSPDGSRIVYSLTTADRESGRATSQLHLCDRDGSGARRLTWGGERNAGARWSPDGRTIAFVSDRVRASGLFVLPIGEPGEAREVARHGRPIADLAWSPDGRQIAYVAPVDPDDPAEAAAEPPAGGTPRVRVTRRLDYKQDGQGYLGDVRRQVFVVDVASGQRRQLTAEPLDHSSPRWSPDGRQLAAQVVRLNGFASQLALLDVATGAARRLGPAAGAVGTWAWSPGGERILLSGETGLSPQANLFVADVASGAVRRLTDDLPCAPDAGFAGVVPPAHPVWLDEHRALFHALRAGASGLYVVDCATGRLELLQTWPALDAGLSVDAAARYAVLTHASPAAVGEVVVVDRETGGTQVVTAHNAARLRESPPAAVERLEVRRGEYAIDTWLLRPPDFDPQRRYPVVLDVHGGPHSYFGYGFNALHQCLATHGFLVVAANPRGSGSYGRGFAEQVIGDWGGEDYLDLQAALDAALALPGADAGRLGISGYSYGGYMTAWTIGQTSRFRTALCGGPVFDLESFFGTSDIGHVFGEWQFGGRPAARREWLAAHSPSTFAHRATTPTLIYHGEADERCPIGQAEQMFVALAQAGCEVELVRYPGGSHLFQRTGPPEHRRDCLTRALAWLKRHLGDPA